MKNYYTNIQQEIDILLDLESKITDNQKLKILGDKKKEFFDKNIKQIELFKEQYANKETDTVKTIFALHKALETLHEHYSNEPFFKDYTLRGTLQLLSRTEELNKVRDGKENGLKCLDDLSNLYKDIRDGNISTKEFNEKFKLYKEQINNVEGIINFKSNLAARVRKEIDKQTIDKDKEQEQEQKTEFKEEIKEEQKLEENTKENTEGRDNHPIVVDGEKEYNKLNIFDKFKAKVNAYELSEGKQPTFLRKVGLFLYSKTYSQDAKDYISNGDIKTENLLSKDNFIKTAANNTIDKGLNVVKESGKWMKAKLEKDSPFMAKDKLTRLGAYADLAAVIALATLSHKAVSNTLQPYQDVISKTEVQSLDENAIKRLNDNTLKIETVTVSYPNINHPEHNVIIEKDIDNQKPKEVETLERDENVVSENSVETVSENEVENTESKDNIDNKEDTKKKSTKSKAQPVTTVPQTVTVGDNNTIVNPEQTDSYYRYESETELREEEELRRQEEQNGSEWRYESEDEKREEEELRKKEQEEQTMGVDEQRESEKVQNEVEEIGNQDNSEKEENKQEEKNDESVVLEASPKIDEGQDIQAVQEAQEIKEQETQKVQEMVETAVETATETVATAEVTNAEIQEVLNEIPAAMEQQIGAASMSAQELQSQIDQLSAEIAAIMAKNKYTGDFNIDLGVQAMSILKANGLSQEAAAGIVGNVFAESRFSTEATNGTHFGLCQWGTGRYATVTAWMKANGKSGFAGQLEAALYGEPNYADVVQRVRNAQTIEEACRIWQKDYEVCGAATETRKDASHIADIASKRSQLQMRLNSLQINSPGMER